MSSKFLKELSSTSDVAMIFQAISELAAGNEAPIYTDKHRELRLWNPSVVQSPAQRLGPLVDSILAVMGEDYFGSTEAQKAILPSKMEENGWEFSKPYQALTLARQIEELEAEIKAGQHDEIGKSNTSRIQSAIQAAKAYAHRFVYYSVTKNPIGKTAGEINYRFDVLFFALGRKLNKTGIEPIAKAVTSGVKLKKGDALECHVGSRACLSSGPTGDFAEPGEIAMPGYSVKSPNGYWSSICCIVAKKSEPSKPLILGSGHGLTDFFWAKVGDTVSRPVSTKRSTSPIGKILSYETPKTTGHKDVSIIEHDFALVEPFDNMTVNNTVRADTKFGRLEESRQLDERDFAKSRLDVSKVGAKTGYQKGYAQKTESLITSVDNFGNTILLKDQITLTNSSRQLAKQIDSGGLVFEERGDKMVGLGGITATYVGTGMGGMSYASTLHEFLEKHDLMLIEVV